MKDEIITGLDIGSTTIKAVVGQPLTVQGEERRLHIIAAAEHESQGVNRGQITSLEDATSAISLCIDSLERKLGVPIDTAWVGISGGHIISQASRGVVAVGKVNGEISRQDVERALEAAKTIATPPNYDILHVIPRSAAIDGRAGIKDPIGMLGVRLEMDTHIVLGLSSFVKTFTKCVYRTGLEIEDLVFSPLAAAETLLTSRQKELGVALVIIGGSSTCIVIYEQGELLHTAVIPIGSEHITADIAIGLRLGLETAEKIKLHYGTLFTREVNKKSEIDLAEIDPVEHGTVSHKYISEIIEARVEEILDKIELELKKVGRNGVLPAGVVLTGGGSRLPGILEFAKKRLKLPASITVPRNVVADDPHILDNQEFTTAIGLAQWGFDLSLQRSQGGGMFGAMHASGDLQDRVKKWLKSLLP